MKLLNYTVLRKIELLFGKKHDEIEFKKSMDILSMLFFGLKRQRFAYSKAL